MSRITKIGIPSGGTTSQVLVKNSNTDYDVTWGAGGGGITGSGTSGYVTFWNGSSTVTGEANLFWDATNDRLGIGTSSPAYELEISKSVSHPTNSGAVAARVINTSSTGQAAIAVRNDNSAGALEIFGSSWVNAALQNKVTFTSLTSAGLDIVLYNNSTSANFSIKHSTATTEKLRLFGSTGNLVIQNGGSFTDAGYRLDVNGTVRIQDNLTISDAKNIILGTTTGTKIGTATTQKIGFFNATPVVQPSAVTTSQGIADALTSLGLLATSTISGAGGYSISTKTTTYTETAINGEIVLLGDTTTAGFTITLPSAVSNTAKITIKKIAGANNLTIDGNGSQTIDGGLTADLVRIYESVTLVSDNSNWHII